MGGRKFRLGKRKNEERKRQLTKKNTPGRPPKSKKRKCDAADGAVEPCNLKQLYDLLVGSIPQSWNLQLTADVLRLFKLQSWPCSSNQPLTVTFSISIQSDFSWKLFVYGNLITIRNTPLSAMPELADFASVKNMICILDESHLCPGNSDESFLAMAVARKGQFLSSKKEVIASVEANTSVSFNNTSYTSTIRSTSCSILVKENQCQSCKKYRDQLRAMYSRWSKKGDEVQKFANNRYLNTPQKKKKLKDLQTRAYSAEREVKKLKEKIEKATERCGVDLEKSLSTELCTIMEDNNSEITKLYPEGTFRRLFWDEQLKINRMKNAKQMRWHPCMIRWCLNLKLLSSSAYHSLRTSGFIKLPSERTLSDYTHYVKSRIGFHADLDKQLADEAELSKLPDWKKHIVLSIDEMKLKEGLVYNKNEIDVIGFVDLGDVQNQLTQLERECSSGEEHPPLATHILVIMVRGIFTRLRFPYAHFATKNLTSETLFTIMWEAIERLENIGFKVLVITADGASPNRKFFRLHEKRKTHSPYDPVYKTVNPYTNEKRALYFMSDVPHLMKTTRNNWSHSFAYGCTRRLWINGKSISWTHLERLYHAKLEMASRSSGLFLLPKLRLEHIQLTSYSRMRVNLAAQVLSQTVANALEFYGDPNTSETKRFVEYFDAFFDCLNVRNLQEHIKKKKKNLKPYTSPDDERLTWLKDKFLGYLEEWKKSVKSRPNYTEGEKSAMCLSYETLEGLHMTVNSFVEVTRYLLKLPGVENQYVLSECFCQDALENYFGQLRARGGRCDNPTVQSCLDSAQSIRVQRSFAMEPVRGNSSRKRRLFQGKDVIDESPLPKRPRRQKK